MNKHAFLAASVFGLLAFTGTSFADPATPTTAAPAATTPSATTAAASTAPAEDPNQIICKSGDPVTGSRLGTRRFCHTRQQWQELQDESQKQTTDIQMRGMQGGRPGG